MRILVTGGAGFIGGHTAEALLRRGSHVVVVDSVNEYYDQAQKFHTLAILEAAAARYGGSFCVYRVDLRDRDRIKEVFASRSLTPLFSNLRFQIFSRHNFDVVCHLAAQAGVRYSIDHAVGRLDGMMGAFV